MKDILVVEITNQIETVLRKALDINYPDWTFESVKNKVKRVASLDYFHQEYYLDDTLIAEIDITLNKTKIMMEYRIKS